jgi:alkanesulfonate monooxygenase SsuD/methylene tetrahydromethanopterin reductase-like flavin-dependent oxidoreductase (luciferase family)
MVHAVAARSRLRPAAAVTERVRIALTVMVRPLHASALAAKQIATLDVL